MTLPLANSNRIKARYGSRSRGWGSLPVLVAIRKTTWKTSIFPDHKSGAYLLPLKTEVRRAEQIHDGDAVQYSLKITGMKPIAIR